MSFLMNHLKMTLMNVTQFAYDSVLDFTWPAFDVFHRLRPIIFLPFNIWFFFVSLPFRIFFFLISGLNYQNGSKKTLDLKDTTVYKDRSTIEEKEVMTKKTETVVPAITVSKASPEMLRQRRVFADADRPFSWYSVSATAKVEQPVVQTVIQTAVQTGSIFDEFKSQLEEIKQKKEEVMPKEIQVDQSDELKGRLEEYEQREKAAMEEKQLLESQLDQLSNKFYANEKSVNMEKQRLESQLKDLSGKYASDEKAAAEEKHRLESQLKDLTQKFETDEKALASFEADRNRFKQMIAVQQKKSFDFQQDIIALKNQLKSEQANRLKAQQELDSMKKQAKADKRHARKANKTESAAQTESSPAPASTSTPVVESKSTPVVASKSVEDVKPAWTVQHHEKDYTEMVAAAQHEQQDHKSFSEVVKESLEVKPAEKSVSPVEEFTVIGGDLSSKHVVDVASTSDDSKSAPVESKPVEAAKPAWHIPHHENDFTEMVAAAQHEQQDHKSFSEVVKESLEVKSTPTEESTKPVDEFTVVGGDLSAQHVTSVNAI